ncbi:hypothetical protein [Alkalimonas amylolytica]|uniref:Outer membrane protein beta-barrel domain-containing protein n=1 Tax=Alkalimonas amylolytica TaxID=152573 RepID=A0A1H4D060_ALKAM|nr:hypothetical protein [Alkalimonas amylolytica]SEA66094.1 hypothetical protein SAMN04488051_1057 [Alkalimonas amylolytica]
MKKFTINALILASLATGIAAAHAQVTPETDFFGYAKLGTQGITVGMGYVINDSFSARIGASSGSTYDGTRRIDDIRYDVSRKTGKSMEALIDWYPFADNGFRISGGAIFNDTSSSLTARPDASGNLTINGNSYAAAQIGNLEGSLRASRVSPYLGAGWESKRPNKPGLRIFVDLGVIHYKTERASLLTSNEVDSTQLYNDLQAERSRIKAVNDAALVASIGVAFSF